MRVVRVWLQHSTLALLGCISEHETFKLRIAQQGLIYTGGSWDVMCNGCYFLMGSTGSLLGCKAWECLFMANVAEDILSVQEMLG